jgi:hypothetical protein
MQAGVIAQLVIATVIAACSGDVPADEDAIRSWLMTRLGSPPAIETMRGVKVVVEFDPVSSLSAAELDQLRSQVEGKPDHPRRSELRFEEWVRSPDRRPYIKTVWVGEDQVWRLSQDLPWAPADVAYLDAAGRSDGAWQLTPQEIVLSGPLSDSASSAPSVAMHRASVSELSAFFDGGLTQRRGSPPELTSLEVSELSWRATIEGNYSVSVVSGVWDASHGVGLVAEDRLELRVPGQAPVGVVTRYSGWAPRLDGSAVVAGMIEREDSRTNGVLRMRLRAVERVENAEIVRVCVTPDPSGIDPVRGQLRVRSITDFGDRLIRERSALDVAGLHSRVIGRTAGEISRLRTFGWAVLGILVALLVFLRLRGGAKS